MTDLPKALNNGQCADCEKKPAITNDNRFCRSCLRKRIKESNPIVSIFSDEIGRHCRNPKMLAGCAEMGTDGDNW